MAIKIRKGWNALLTAILGFFGVSCVFSEKYGIYIPSGPVAMYGVPTATYQVQGSVQSEDGEPLKDIQVVYDVDYYKQNLEYGRTKEDTLRAEEQFTVRTDELGHFLIRTWDQEWPIDSLELEFNDTDGPENGGEFESATTKVKLQYKRPDDYNGWYAGVGYGEANVTLRRRTPSNFPNVEE